MSLIRKNKLYTQESQNKNMALYFSYYKLKNLKKLNDLENIIMVYKMAKKSYAEIKLIDYT